ncbi:hypothetical protein HCQ94_00775 [Actinomyces sp. zg-332]|uniref:hypothetical protein n=1 Tax=Actinomyces sp. zg-332 TaxID=2708340 RepID=UPI0018C31078|nr:hypothetical protein [Actinomyces sp. zg-332]QPK94283.1 hypothetical protein HCQ94_00775 [Actinomyces sp. zg-332]
MNKKPNKSKKQKNNTKHPKKSTQHHQKNKWHHKNKRHTVQFTNNKTQESPKPPPKKSRSPENKPGKTQTLTQKASKQQTKTIHPQPHTTQHNKHPGVSHQTTPNLFHKNKSAGYQI